MDIFSCKKYNMDIPPGKKYNIIYADPPWPYDNARDDDPAQGGKTYKTMTLAEIKDMPVAKIADDNCALFLWATMPKLKEALEVGEAWGFRYITCAFTWVKLNPRGRGVYSGLGHYTNGNAELCLLFKKGKIKRVERNVKQIQMHPRGKHSAKPPEIRNEIVRLLGDLPRIELFAREYCSGWDSYGDELATNHQAK